MAQLVFTHNINLTEYDENTDPKLVESLMIANEPNNDIWQYYIKNSRTNDKQSHISYANYSSLEWALPSTHLTSQRVRQIGIKHFPQIGAIGLFTYKYEERTKILAPIHPEQPPKYKKPFFTCTYKDNKLYFKMAAPKEITYLCYRIICRVDNDAYEYITYENELTVNAPRQGGTYDIYCIGYIDEGQAISEDSVHYDITIPGTPEPPVPENDVFVTKSEFLEDKTLRLYLSNGQQINSNYMDVYNVKEIDDKISYNVKEIDDKISHLEQLLLSADELLDKLNGEVI